MIAERVPIKHYCCVNCSVNCLE